MTFLTLRDDEMYQLAKETATYKERGLTLDDILKHIGDKFSPATVNLWSLLGGGYIRLSYRTFLIAVSIRQDELNRTQPGE